MLRPNGTRKQREVAGTTRCTFGQVEPGDLEEQWTRTENGDVHNLRAFNKHMATVGEEDQSQPGWDDLP